VRGEPETARSLRVAVGRQPSAASRKLIAVSPKLTRPRASGTACRLFGGLQESDARVL
jgi:hypothetical protein